MNPKEWDLSSLGQRVIHKNHQLGTVVALGTITGYPLVHFDKLNSNGSHHVVVVMPELLTLLDQRLTLEEMLTHEEECLREYALNLTNGFQNEIQSR